MLLNCYLHGVPHASAVTMEGGCLRMRGAPVLVCMQIAQRPTSDELHMTSPNSVLLGLVSLRSRAFPALKPSWAAEAEHPFGRAHHTIPGMVRHRAWPRAAAHAQAAR